MDLSNYLCTFAGKFTNFILIMQANHEELTSLGLLSYYGKLTQKEKVRLKNYVAQKFDLSYYTVDGKFRGKANFSAAELLAMQPIIQSETWRQ